jgi:hypothetical protein
MEMNGEKTLHLIDAEQRQLGQITIECMDEDLVLGTFAPGPDFPKVEDLFHNFEEAVNLQVLSIVDELDAQIGALGLRLCPSEESEPIRVYDVQIWSDGNVTCRLRDDVPLPTDGVQASTEPTHAVEAVHLTEVHS